MIKIIKGKEYVSANNLPDISVPTREPRQQAGYWVLVKVIKEVLVSTPIGQPLPNVAHHTHSCKTCWETNMDSPEPLQEDHAPWRWTQVSGGKVRLQRGKKSSRAFCLKALATNPGPGETLDSMNFSLSLNLTYVIRPKSGDMDCTGETDILAWPQVSQPLPDTVLLNHLKPGDLTM